MALTKNISDNIIHEIGHYLIAKRYGFNIIEKEFIKGYVKIGFGEYTSLAKGFESSIFPILNEEQEIFVKKYLHTLLAGIVCEELVSVNFNISDFGGINKENDDFVRCDRINLAYNYDILSLSSWVAIKLNEQSLEINDMIKEENNKAIKSQI